MEAERRPRDNGVGSRRGVAERGGKGGGGKVVRRAAAYRKVFLDIGMKRRVRNVPDRTTCFSIKIEKWAT